MKDFADKVRAELPAFREQYPDWQFGIDDDILLTIYGKAGDIIYNRHIGLPMIQACQKSINQVLQDECDHVGRMLVIRARKNEASK